MGWLSTTANKMCLSVRNANEAIPRSRRYWESSVNQIARSRVSSTYYLNFASLPIPDDKVATVAVKVPKHNTKVFMGYLDGE